MVTEYFLHETEEDLPDFWQVLLGMCWLGNLGDYFFPQKSSSAFCLAM